MRWILCVALLCSCLPASAAQSSDQAAPTKPAAKKEPPPGTLHSVVIKGNHLYPSQEIVRESGLKPGQRVTGAVIEQARLKLQSTELFNNVSDEYRFTAGAPPGYDVTFQVAENEQLFPMRFERIGVSPEAARQYLREHVTLYADRIPGTEGVLHRYTAAVQDLVAKTNPALKVRALVSNDDPQQLAVLFTSDAPVPTISQVIVTGNQAVDTGTLLRALNQVAVGTPLYDTRIQQILNGTIKPLYAAKGYAAVTFPKVETEHDKSNLGLILKVEIKDGPLFKLGAIHFHGSGMDEEEIRSNIPVKPGQTFNGELVDNFRLELIHRMKRRGLLDANVSTESQPDESKRVVNVTYNVVPGEVYNFAKLDMQGLDITTQPVIEKLWGEKPGKPFNPDYPDFFLKRVQQQGLFDNLADTHSDYSTDPSTHNVTVHLYFKGGQSRNEEERKKKEEEEKRKSDGTWSPY
jgi:outer membrane protein insertion porin family